MQWCDITIITRFNYITNLITAMIYMSFEVVMIFISDIVVILFVVMSMCLSVRLVITSGTIWTP